MRSAALVAYFSFGNPLIFGDKSAIGCVQKLDVERLLMETDAPYQTMRGEDETKMSAIVRVYETAFFLRYGKESCAKEKTQMFSDTIFNNFKSAYGIA